MEENHMLARERPPSYSQSHDPQTINLPSVPRTEGPPIHHERTLPPLSFVVPESSHRAAEVADFKYPAWPSTNPLTAYYQPSLQKSPSTRSTMGTDSPSAMDIDAMTPDSRSRRGGSVLSIDDPDVRIAAEALGDLRADFIQSPPLQHSSLPPTTSHPFQQRNATAQQLEPLLSLLTTSHPLIGTAIGGSLSAYSASKNYSPRFKSSAEYVERRFTPVVNTVGSVGRVTGVEGGVRWFLGGRRPSHHPPSDLETADEAPNKRRKTGRSEMDVNRNESHEPLSHQETHFQHRERRPSQVSTAESLPAYDDHRSPSYEIHDEHALVPTNQESASNPGATWQSRLILSTSGLSVAMSEESLRSLKYCLNWLRWANDHIGKVIDALRSVLEQYDNTSKHPLTNGEKSDGGQLILRTDAERSAFNTKIAELKSDVLKTLKDVVDVVSRYAGGALPENARILVRRHLTSLPQRFKLASTNDSHISDTAMNSNNSGDSEVREGARRVIVLAKEGLDMMAQVSGVLDGTIVSAEEWCDRLGRKKTGEADGEERSKDPSQMSHSVPRAANVEREEMKYRDDVKMV